MKQTGCSAVRLAHLLWEQGVPGSNPGIPTNENQGDTANVAPFFVSIVAWLKWRLKSFTSTKMSTVKTMNNATINVVCYKWKTLANGENPLMLRVTKDGKAKYQSLGISVNPKFWNFKKNEPKPKCPNFEQIQKIILDKKLEIQRKMLEIRAEQKEYTATTLLIKEKHQSFTVYGGPYVLSMDRTNWQF